MENRLAYMRMLVAVFKVSRNPQKTQAIFDRINLSAASDRHRPAPADRARRRPALRPRRLESNVQIHPTSLRDARVTHEVARQHGEHRHLHAWRRRRRRWRIADEREHLFRDRGLHALKYA